MSIYIFNKLSKFEEINKNLSIHLDWLTEQSCVEIVNIINFPHLNTINLIINESYIDRYIDSFFSKEEGRVLPVSIKEIIIYCENDGDIQNQIILFNKQKIGYKNEFHRAIEIPNPKIEQDYLLSIFKTYQLLK